VAALAGCQSGEILFTSCGTESINTAIQSALALDPDKRHIVTSAVEHSATLRICEDLAGKGFEITRLPVDASGQLDLDELKAAIRPETALVSLLWANNETGVLWPLEKIAGLVQKTNAILHIDAVQAFGKIPLRLEGLGVHFMSFSGHKIHAPKGVGALYINRRVPFTPFLRGTQENGRRGGTQNVVSIVAFGKAAELAAKAHGAPHLGGKLGDDLLIHGQHGIEELQREGTALPHRHLRPFTLRRARGREDALDLLVSRNGTARRVSPSIPARRTESCRGCASESATALRSAMPAKYA
jgi:cysteine sulfinate desulfinase/cysteine desulfurase-like protein